MYFLLVYLQKGILHGRNTRLISLQATTWVVLRENEGVGPSPEEQKPYHVVCFPTQKRATVKDTGAQMCPESGEMCPRRKNRDWAEGRRDGTWAAQDINKMAGFCADVEMMDSGLGQYYAL